MATLMEANKECLFCHETLDPGLPMHLAFVTHMDDAPACRDEFDWWAEFVSEDFGGD